MLNRFYFVLFFVLLAIVVVALFVTPTISASAQTDFIQAFIPYVVAPTLGSYISNANPSPTTACDCTVTFSYRTSNDGDWLVTSQSVVRLVVDLRSQSSWHIEFYFDATYNYPSVKIYSDGRIRYIYNSTYSNYVVRDGSIVVQSNYNNLGVSSSETYTITCLQSILTPITAVIELTALPSQYIASSLAPDLPIDCVYSVSLYNVSSVDYSLQKYIDEEWQTIDSALYSGANFTIVFYEAGQYRLFTYDTTSHSYIYSNSVNVQFDLWQRPYNSGYSIGFDEGYRDGMQEAPDILPSLVFAVPDTIIGMLIGTYDTNPDSDTYHTYVGGLFNFTLFGYDMRDFIVSLVCIVVIVKLIALILGGTGKDE